MEDRHEDHSDEKYTSHHPERNLRTRVPRVKSTSEVYTHGEADGTAKEDGDRGPVNDSQFLCDRHFLPEINAGQAI